VIVDDETDRRSRNASRLLAVALVVILLAGGALGAYSISSLFDRAASSQSERQHAAELIAAVRTIDGLEWRVAAGQDYEPLRGTLAAAKEQLGEVLRHHRDLESVELQRQVDTYLLAIDQEFAALQSGDAAEAKRVDEALVDPAFEDVIADASTFAETKRIESEKTLRNVRRLLWTETAVLVSLLGGLLWWVLHRRDRARSRELTSESDRRFRSLVESSADVITTVDREGTLSVVSPKAGSLARFALSPEMAAMSDLLPSPLLDEWTAADCQLRDTATPQTLEMLLTDTDGRSASFQAKGTGLVADSGVTVWAWSDITQRKELERELAYQAFHDLLTGLANRARFEDQTSLALTRGTRLGHPVSIMFCDLDDFKIVNDTLGHAAGDELLVAVADRLANSLRAVDLIARFGGDEFVVLLEDHDAEAASKTAERMMAALSREITLRDRKVFPATSVGIATSNHGGSAEELLRNADTALYAAKRTGKNRIAVFHTDMQTGASASLESQSDLSNAMRDGELSLHYQPTLNLASGRVTGVEALVRWHHPTRGLISPASFIPLAEGTGQIVSIGRWLLREACRTVALLQTSAREPLSVHVNISPRQLHDPTLVAHVEHVLFETGLAPNLLVLEVTEGVLLDDAAAVQRLHQLRALGLRVAIDDFGTGYTSIHYLQQLPTDILKIDRSFVSGNAIAAPERIALVGAIISLAKALNLRTVAEGIETEEQARELRDLGCDAGQGFLWSRAVPKGELPALLQDLARRAERDGLSAATRTGQ
jgi:diguanylate cyclase (GGDEF)-like protein/PAS domain S-box-containing protein